MAFIRALSLLGPILSTLLALIPGLHPAAIPHIVAGIAAAETIPGATGPQKLSAAVSIATAGLQTAQALGAPIDAAALADSLPSAVNSIVKVVNDVHKGAPASV